MNRVRHRFRFGVAPRIWGRAPFRWIFLFLCCGWINGVICLGQNQSPIIPPIPERSVQMQPGVGMDKDTDLWVEANLALSRGQYDVAVDAYENLMATRGLSVEVLHNFAMAQYRQSKLIPALAAWECAAQINPRDRDVRLGLKWVRQRLKLTPDPIWVTGLQRVTLNEWAGLTTTFAWVWCGMLVVSRLHPSSRDRLRRWVIGVGMIAFILGLLSLTGILQRKWGPQGRVHVEEARVRQAPVVQARQVTTLKSGETIRVGRRHLDWFEVYSDGKRLGWLSAQDFLGTVPEVEGPRRLSASSVSVPNL